MRNDEVSREVVAIVKKGSIKGAKEVIKLMNQLLRQAKKQQKKLGQVIKEKKPTTVKDLVKKGKVETLELNDVDMKNLKRELARNGVKFSIKRDVETGNNIIFFEAKDEKVMEHAFNKAVHKFKNQDKKRTSVIERLNTFKEKVKNTISKDKVKNKQQEQSL